MDRKKALFSAFDRTAKQAEEPEELEGAEDGDPDGDSATQEGERYYGMLSAQIKRNYSLPDTLSEQERLQLKALIRIRIGNAGQLLDAALVKGSENSQFDNAVLAAVKRRPTLPAAGAPAADARRARAFRWSSSVKRLALLMLCVLSVPALAQEQVLQISGANFRPLPLAVPAPLAEPARRRRHATSTRRCCSISAPWGPSSCWTARASWRTRTRACEASGIKFGAGPTSAPRGW